MAASKNRFLCFPFFLFLIFTEISALPKAYDHGDEHPEFEDSYIRTELDLLNSKLSFLESSIDERNRELKSKDKSIKQMKKILQEKSDIIASIQREIEYLQPKTHLDAKDQDVQAGELEKQVEKLRKDIETQNERNDALEAQANVAQRKIVELNSKLENLQLINDEQKARIRKTENALQLAEEKLMKAKFEAASVSNEFVKVYGAWLPRWLSTHLGYFQSYIVICWNDLGRPALEMTIEKALEKKAQIGNWSEPHIERLKVEWIPVIKEGWLTLIVHLEQYFSTLTTKTIEAYHASKSSIQKWADPYIQRAKNVIEPYISQIAQVTKPHYSKAQIALKPHTKMAVSFYRRFMRSAVTYHHRVQEMLKDNELTRPLATMELAWFAATAFLALHVIFVSKLFSAIFSKKAKKRTYSFPTNHTRHRAKRVHVTSAML